MKYPVYLGSYIGDKKDIRKLVKNDNDFLKTKFKNVASSDNKDMIFKLFAKDEHPFWKPHNIINYDSLRQLW